LVTLKDIAPVHRRVVKNLTRRSNDSSGAFKMTDISTYFGREQQRRTAQDKQADGRRLIYAVSPLVYVFSAVLRYHSTVTAGA
jgi:hypothetical protein